MQSNASVSIETSRVYRKTLSFDREPLLSQHCIQGVGVFPAAAQLEMVVAGVQHLTQSSSFRVRNITFTSPLLIGPGEESTTELSFYSQRESYDFQLKSVDGNIHSSGKVNARQSVMPEWLSLADLRNRMSRTIDANSINDWYKNCGIQYGSDFRTVAEILLPEHDTKQALVLLKDVDASSLKPFYLKPVLLDGALHSLGMLLDKLGGSSVDGGVYLPYYIGDLSVFSPLTGSVYCWLSSVGLEGNDKELLRTQLTLLSPQGQVLLEAKDVILKRQQTHEGQKSAGQTLSVVPSTQTPTQSATKPEKSANLQQSFHHLTWQPKEKSYQQSSINGSWIVLSDGEPLSKELVSKVRNKGVRCIEVHAGRRYLQADSDCFFIDPTCSEDFTQLVNSVGGVSSIAGVIHAWQVTNQENSEDLRLTTLQLEEGIKSAILLSQSVGNEARKPLRFVLVTGDAQLVTNNDKSITPTRSASWGVLRTVAQEYHHLKTCGIDISTDELNGHIDRLCDRILQEATDDQLTPELAYRNGQRYEPELIIGIDKQRPSWRVRQGGCYLISGGLGDLGLTIATYLASKGAGHLILIGRSAPNTIEQLHCEQGSQRQSAVANLQKMGIKITTLCCDVTDSLALQNAVQSFQPINGIIHCAGLVKDGLIRNKSLDSVEAVLAPKIYGTLNLASIVSKDELDFFVLFSSLSSVLGNFGQVDYAAANAYLDAYALSAHKKDLPFMSLSWGPWRGMGMLADDANLSNGGQKFTTIDVDTGLALFDYALQNPRAHWAIFQEQQASNADAQLRNANQPKPEQKPDIKPIPPVAQTTEVVDLKTQVRATLTAAFIKVMAIPAEELEPDSDLLAMGLTSLMAVDVKSSLESDDFTLDPALFFRYPSIEELSESLCESYPNELAQVLGVTQTPDTQHKNAPEETALGSSYLGAQDAQLTTANQVSKLDDLPDFMRRRIDEISRDDVECVDRGEYFYEPEIQETKEAWAKIGDRKMLMLASYSYLDLIGHPKINAAARDAIDKFGTGTHGVRLLAGTTVLHRQLEREIARFKDAEDAIVYSSGFMTNVTTISALVGKGDVIIGDMFNHASIVDGCLQSGAKLLMFGHNDMQDLERNLLKAGDANKLVIVDAVFSMDGDIANLPEIVKLCKKYGAALMVDEAHSTGVLGATGKGIEEHFGMPPGTVDIKMGTLSKTIPSVGGYITGCRELIFALKNNARAFIFSAALPPAQTAAAIASLEVIRDEPERIHRLRNNVQHYLDGLDKYGFRTFATETPVIPVICKTSEQAIHMAQFCQDKGIFVQPIVYPAVPINAPRLRTIITAAHTTKDIDYVLETLVEAGRAAGLLAH